MGLKIRLVDRNEELVKWWQHAFSDCPDVTAVCGDFFEEPADVMVSPANSFGIMDGGLDLAIRETLGSHVETTLRQAIWDEDGGELLVGQAKLVWTAHDRWPWMISAPTMRVPESIQGTVNAYLAFRAVLREMRKPSRTPLKTLVCPGLGTGVGKLDPSQCAAQMRYAYGTMERKEMPTFGEIRLVHAAMTLSASQLERGRK